MGGTSLTPAEPGKNNDISPPDGTTRDLPDGERLFRVLFEQAAVGVGLLDTRTGLILRVNRKYQEIMGYTEDELVGLDFMRITYPEDLPGDLAQMERLTAGEIREFSMEKRLLRRDGTPVWVDLTVSPMWPPGDPPSQHIAVVVDITARRAAEEQQRSLEAQLRQAQKMEALGTLAGGIAHDFNNLLAMVGLNAQLIRSRLPADHPVREQLDTMDTVVHRGARLIQQILAFSRKQPVSRAIVPVNDAVLEAANMLRAMLPAGVDIAVTTDDAAPGVLADATQLQQVLINLGTNAWQAIERGIGGIRFSVATVTSSTDPLAGLAGDHVRIRVEDDGVGMTPATLERIFEPFFTTKEPGKGSGLGLSVVHGIVEEHGGFIRVKSNPDQGSIFEVFLPLRQPSPAAPVELAPVPRGNGARVYYVDDEPSLLKPVLGLLGLLGYQATGFSSPTVALEQLCAVPHAVDLLITDLGMPGLSGLDLARRVSAIRPGLPILLASGYAPLSDEELLAAGIRGRLPKPFNLRQLSEALSAHLPAPTAGPGLRAEGPPAASGPGGDLRLVLGAMPPRVPPAPPPAPSRRLPASRVLDFLDGQRLDGVLTALLPDPRERAFVLRTILDEGPIHHRGANWVLLALLAERLGPGKAMKNEGAEVALRLPPHLAGQVDEAAYPLRLPLEPLERLAGGDPERVAAMVDCLTDGPPHHALANVLLVRLIEALEPRP